MLVSRAFILACSLFLSYVFVTAEYVFAEPAQLTISKTASNDINHEDYYFTQLLNLALTKTASQYGAVNIVELSTRQVDKRLRVELLNHNIDLLWSPTSPELESEFLPIKISLLKELNNYRLLLIRPETQAQFSRVNKLNDLRQFIGGMGAQWVDADIMEANNLPLVKVAGYGRLFKMLAAKRFDYFSRGLYQVETEVNFYPELALAIEKNLMLHYQNEVYFFVRKDDLLLAERLKLGLEIAQKDGSFDRLFNSIPRYQWGVKQLKRHHRRIIDLQLKYEPTSQLKAEEY